MEDFIIEENKDEKCGDNTDDNKKDGKVKVKFESIKKVEIINKKDIEKLILIDEQKEKNECKDK